MLNYIDLFEACKRGEPRAQRILYDLFKSKLMGLCRRYTRNRDDALDILQDAFIRIFNNLYQLESSDKLESWMKTIVVRVAINHYHKSKTKDQLFQQMDTIGAEDTGYEGSLEGLKDEHLISAVNSLPDGCRIIFNMVAVEGYSHVEVGSMLSISEGTSRSQYHYAKQLLKEKLKCQNLMHYYEKFA